MMAFNKYLVFYVRSLGRMLGNDLFVYGKLQYVMDHRTAGNYIVKPDFRI